MRRRHIYNNPKFNKPLNTFSPDNIGYRTVYNSNKFTFGMSPKIELYIGLSTGQVFTYFANPRDNLQSIIYKCLEENKLINYKNKIGAILFDGRTLVLNKTLSDYNISDNSRIVVMVNNIEEESKTSLGPKIELYISLTTGQKFRCFANPRDNLQSIIYKCLEDNKLISYKNRIGAILFEGRTLALNKTLSEYRISNNSRIIVMINNIEEESKISNFGKSLKYSFSSSTIFTENNVGKMDNRKQNFFESEDTNLCNETNECIHIHNNKHNHGLVLLFSNSDYSCKICKKAFMKNIATYFCSLCKFDACYNCIGNGRSILNKFNNEQNQLESYKFPCHEHEMVYCRISSKNKNMNKTYTCDLCFRSYNHSIWSFYCTNCNYYICLSCSKRYIPASKFINIGIKINAHNHKLVYMVTKRKWTCKLCQKSYDKYNPTYYCSKCNYDVCEKCMKKKDNFDRIALYVLLNSSENPNNNIINGDCHIHPLIYCNTHGLNKKEKWICSKCSKNYKNDWSFYCTLCNFYLCYDCYINSIQK